MDEANKLYGEACGHYQHVIDKIAPKDEVAYAGLGDVHVAQGEKDKAIKTWQKGLEQTNGESVLLNSRLAELLVSEGRLEEFYPDEPGKENRENPLRALARLIDKLRTRESQATVSSLERSLDMLNARWLASKGDSLQVIALLKKVLTGRQSTPAEVRQALQAEMLLGSVYAATGDWNLATVSYEHAATLEPKMVQPRLLAASAWMTADRPEMAVHHYETVLSLDDDALRSGKEHVISGSQRAEAWFALARAEYQRQVKLPGKDRNWEAFSKAFDKAKNSGGEDSLANPWRAELLMADYLVVRADEQQPRDQKKIEEAIDLLRQAEAKYATSADLLQRLSLFYERLQSPEDADRALAKFDGLAGNVVMTYLLRCELLCGRQQYEEARKVLQKGLTTLPAEVHTVLEQTMAQINLREGNAQLSQSQLLELQSKQPENQGVIRQLIDLAFEAGRMDEVERWEQKLRQVEGPNGIYSQYVEARRLLESAKSPDDPSFVRGADLLAQLQQRRPAWPRVRWLTGVVAQTRGDADEAIRAYQDVIRLEPAGVLSYERLIHLLCRAKRFDEATQYLSMAEARGLSSKTLGSLKIAVAAGTGQMDQAVEIARSEVGKNPEDPLAQLNYGQALAANEKSAEAEAAFQQAVRVAPRDIRTYNSLFSYYLRGNQTELARKTLLELAENVKDLPKADLALVLAQKYEQLQDLKEAEARYREAYQLQPEKESFGMHLANFLLQQKRGDEAEKVLRNIINVSPASTAARQSLAGLLVERGGEQEWQEALRLLDEAGATGTGVGPNQRLQALFLIRRGGEENCNEAQRILEELVGQAKASLDVDHLLLAQVYEVQGKLAAATGQYTSVVERATPDPRYVALYIDFLIRNDDLTRADAKLKGLESLVADDLRVMTLRARWLQKMGRVDEVEALIEGTPAQAARTKD